MEILKNNFDESINFSSLEEAKEYYGYFDNDVVSNRDDFLGTDGEFEVFKNNYTKYKQKISEADSLEDLADVLNEYSDIFDNGSRYFIENNF